MAKSNDQLDILSVAHRVFKENLLGDIPEAKKYQAVMVANAMAIAAREQDFGKVDGFSPEFLTSVISIVGSAVPEHELVSTLISDLRDGRFNQDENKAKALHKGLLKEAHRKVEISNPRYLAR